MNKYPKRRRAKLSFKLEKEEVVLPVEISCRSDGICIIKHPRMENIIFPKKEPPDKWFLRKKFWGQLLRRNKKRETKLFANVSPKNYSYITTGAGISGVGYTYEIREKVARVKLDIDTRYKARNKRIFDSLREKKREIEYNFGEKLKWDYKEERRSCYIAFNINGGLSNKKSWGSLQNRMIDKMIKLHGALDRHIQALKVKL